MATKNDALDQILAIAQSHDLTAAEISAALMQADKSGSSHSLGLLGRILALLGGTFVFAGLCIFIALNWDAMNTAARIIITLGSGLAAFIMAIVAAGDERYERARTPLYLIAAVLQPTGLLVAIDKFSIGGDWHSFTLITTAIMVIQQSAIFWKYRDTTLLFTSVFFALCFFGTALDWLNVDGELIALTLGASTIALCVGLERTSHRAVTPFWYFVGSVSFLVGLFEIVERSWLELLFLAAACSGVFLSTYVRSRTLLLVSTVAILSYISYFTGRHFLDSFGWPLLLILLGLILIGLSALAVRISRRYISNA